MEKNTKGCGTLYLCATPIGNLEDITLRVLRTLREVDLIAAEDTRNTIRLLNHYEIKKPLTSYHEHNKIQKAYRLAAQLEEGLNIALVTDAGTPAVSDPGEDLVRICHERGIPVTSLPGCAACVTALSVSGLPSGRFAFEAFLPEEKKERTAILKSLQSETRTILLYEAPHHLRRTLKELYEALGERQICVCRELTKRFETVSRMSLCEAVRFYEQEEPRGEYVLVITGKDLKELRREEQQAWEHMSPAEHVAFYEEQGMDRRDAMKQAAKDRGVGKREIYQALVCEKDADGK